MILFQEENLLNVLNFENFENNFDIKIPSNEQQNQKLLQYNLNSAILGITLDDKYLLVSIKDNINLVWDLENNSEYQIINDLKGNVLKAESTTNSQYFIITTGLNHEMFVSL